MADSRELQKQLQTLREIEKKYNDLSGMSIDSPFKNYDVNSLVREFDSVEKALKVVNQQIRLTQNEIRNFSSGLDDVKGLVDAIGDELGNQKNSLTKVRGQWSKIRGLVTSIYDVQVDIENTSAKDIEKLRKRNKIEFNRLRLLQDQAKATAESSASKATEAEAAYRTALANSSNSEADMKKAIAAEESYKAAVKKADADAAAYQTTLDTVKAQKLINESLDETEQMVQKINSGFGPLGKTFVGIGGLLKKAGFGRMAESIENGEKAMKGLSYDLSEAGTKTIEMNDRWKVLWAGIKGAFGSLFNIKTLIGGGILLAATTLVKKFKHFDEEISNVGKSLGITRDQAADMVKQIEHAAIASESAFINTDRLVHAQLELSKQLGTVVRATDEQLENQALLAEFAGLQGEQLTNSYKASLLTGKSQKDLFNTLNANNDSIFSTNELFREAASTTGQIAVNLGNNPAAIGRAVAQAKRLGISLETARSMADSTLDFESSIAAEMEAQVLTGKSLNLNYARQLAFQGDHVGAAKEMLRQVGGVEEFSRMNVIAQKSLAQAMGLSVDELANQLRDAEANEKIAERRNQLIDQEIEKKKAQAKADGKVYSLQQEAMDRRKAYQQAELQAQTENQTLGEVFSNIMSKISDIVGSLLLPSMVKLRKFLGDGDGVNGYINRIKEAFTRVANISHDVTDATGGTNKQLASIMPSAESIGKLFGHVYKMILGIPDALNTIKQNPIFQMISGLLSTKLGKIGIAAGGIKLLSNALMGRGSKANPIYAIISGAGALGDMVTNLFKKSPKGPLTKAGKPDMRFKANKIQPKTNMFGKIGQSISGGLKTLGSSLATTITKIPGMGAVAKTAGNVVKGGKNVIGKVAGSGLAKGLGKVASKGFLKRIPILGSLVGVGFAVDRLMKGDFSGAAMEAGSAGLGLLDLVAPGVGTGLSLAADAAIAARDYKRASETEMVEGSTEQPVASAPTPTPQESGEMKVSDFVIKSLPEDSLVMAGGTQFGKETNDLLRQVLAAINSGGDVYLDGVKVGNTLSLASYKL